MPRDAIERAEPPDLPRSVWAEGALSVTDAARFMGCSRKFLFDLMGRGELPWGRLGKSRRIPRGALIDLLARTQGGED